MKRYFVTGTDTDVGKTVVSALLVKQLDAYYWKPIQSGIIDIEDKDTVQKISGAPDDKILPCAYELREPLSLMMRLKLMGSVLIWMPSSCPMWRGR